MSQKPVAGPQTTFEYSQCSKKPTERIQYDYTHKQCKGVAKEVSIERVIRIKSGTVKLRFLKTRLHEEYQAWIFRKLIFINGGLKCPMPGRPYMSLIQLK